MAKRFFVIPMVLLVIIFSIIKLSHANHSNHPVTITVYCNVDNNTNNPKLVLSQQVFVDIVTLRQGYFIETNTGGQLTLPDDYDHSQFRLYGTSSYGILANCFSPIGTLHHQISATLSGSDCGGCQFMPASS